MIGQTLAHYQITAVIGKGPLLTLGLLAAGVAAAGVGFGSPPSDSPLGSPVTSIGQPPGVELIWGMTYGYGFDERQPSSRVILGLNSELLLPQLGFLDVTFEGGIGTVGSALSGGTSAHLRFPYANPGIEYDFRDEKPYFKLTGIL